MSERSDRSLGDVLRRTATRFAERPAIAEPKTAITYADLDARSDEIASRLAGLGLAPGSRIGLLRRKSIETVTFIYGILKAGCAYVPIDPKMGPQRLAAVLQDAGLAALVKEPVLMPKLHKLVEDDLLPWLAPALAAASAADDILVFPEAGSGPPGDGELAYILYTSGSTGVPKGVQHTQESALAFVRWAAAQFAVSPSDRLSCHAPLHFDLTTFDLFVAALAGACVVLVPGEMSMFPRQVAALIESEQITIWYSVPFALIQLLDHGVLEERQLALREVIFAGERFPQAQLRRLATTLPNVRLTNLFGPTETNVCTYHHLSPQDIAAADLCPIGLPCPYSMVAIVDASGDEVAPGEKGELLVGGVSVMTGYLNRSQLNEKVFVTRAVDGRATRFFRTGDLVSVPEDGAMRFHGRGDRQVKVRGFRLELDEIEAALASCDGVAAAGVWVEDDPQGFAEVRAAVAVDPAAARPIGEDLILAVRARLLQAAVPSRILVLDELPRTVNGKIDYQALARLLAP